MENAVPDLTPIATEHAQLAAFKADADALGWTPQQAVAVSDPAAVDALLDASFVTQYHRCTCGSMIVTDETRCYPCSQGNRARGPIYGASLAQPSLRPGFLTPTAGITVDWQAPSEPVPGDALRAVEAVWLTPSACPTCVVAQARIDVLLDQNDALVTENGDHARQVVSLKGQLYEAQCALTRAEKVREPLALVQAEERVVDLSRSYDTLVETCTQQANRLAACHCGA